MIGALLLHGHSSQVVLGVGSTQQRKNMMTRWWKKQSQEEEPDDGVEIPANQGAMAAGSPQDTLVEPCCSMAYKIYVWELVSLLCWSHRISVLFTVQCL